ncbi:hypothetical protein [Rhodanobacter sp. FW106-PBR-R2A-1-13]|uniref:hypothetical protein n=1 Tax=Rhodanobacter sp. FW106-PBR-R2A-1-13 TaxID=3454845 RepID=UPI0034E5FD5A
MKTKPQANGVYVVPQIWRGPAGDIPEKIRKEGIPVEKVRVDPSKVVRFLTFTNQLK